MIKLKVEPYCQNCPEFEPTTNGNEHFPGGFAVNIHCVHAGRCSSMYKYLEGERTKEVRRKIELLHDAYDSACQARDGDSTRLDDAIGYLGEVLDY